MVHPLVVYREAEDLTQARLADLIGASQSFISDMETGRRWPSRALARRIETATGGRVKAEALLLFEHTPAAPVADPAEAV